MGGSELLLTFFFLRSLFLRGFSFFRIGGRSRSGGSFVSSQFSSARYFYSSNSSLVRIEELETFNVHVTNFYSVVEVQTGYFYVDVIGHVFRKAVYFQGGALANKCTTFCYAGSLANQTNRNAHFDLTIFGNTQEISVQDYFAHRVELNLLENSLALFAFNVHVYKFRVLRVHKVTEQDHWRMKVNLVITSVQYTRHVTLIAQALRVRLAEICSSIPYNLNSFHNSYIV